MKVTVPQDKLAQGVKRVLNAVSSRTTLPILSNVLLETTETGKLVLIATDLDLSIRTELPVIVEEAGSITVPAKKFAQIVSSLPSGEAVLSAGDNFHLTVACKKSKFKLVGQGSEEYPREEKPDNCWTFTTTCGAMRKGVEKVAYASAAPDEGNRRVLNGILLNLRGGMQTLAATDGRRLAMIERQLPDGVEGEGDVIMPPKLVNEISRLGGDDEKLVVELSDRKAVFSSGDTTVTSKLLEGNFPNYRQAIPGAFTRNVNIPRKEFVEILSRISLVATESNMSVKLTLDKAQMVVSASSAEIGESSEPMAVSYEGEPVVLCFNPQFLLDPFKNLECEHVSLDFNDEYSPVRMQGDDGFLCVIMPMRV